MRGMLPADAGIFQREWSGEEIGGMPLVEIQACADPGYEEGFWE